MQNTINSRNEAPTTAQIMEILSKVHFKTKSKLLLLTCTGIRPTDVWYLKWIDFKWEWTSSRAHRTSIWEDKKGLGIFLH